MGRKKATVLEQFNETIAPHADEAPDEVEAAVIAERDAPEMGPDEAYSLPGEQAPKDEPAADGAPAAPSAADAIERKRTTRRPMAALLGAAESKLTAFDLRAHAAKDAYYAKLEQLAREREVYVQSLPEGVQRMLELGGLSARQPNLPGTEG